MKVNFSKHDLDVAARTCAGEARGEKNRLDAMKRVAHVIINRASVGGWFGETIADVCHKSRQFSCWNEKDPNRDVIINLDKNDPVYSDAVAAVALAAVDDEDPTKGATHYYATFIDAPWWTKNLKETVEFGGHKFYK